MSRVGLIAGWVIASFAASWPCLARPNVTVLNDPAGDAVVRRTDSANSGPFLPGATLPDLVQMRLSGWLPDDPVADPYTGSVVPGNHADLFRLDVVFRGMLNPPGTLGQSGQPYDPCHFGPSPVYGFLEFDIDNNADTGGELGSLALPRYLANAARFGGLPTGALASRTARTGAWMTISGPMGDLDSDFYTTPQFERSGQDFALVLCGCYSVSLVYADSETWIVRSKYFQRAGGYQEASAIYDGTVFLGLYDPVVNLRFHQCQQSNTTTITLVYPLTMHGAALLAGLAVDPPIDTIIDVNGNPSSVIEALSDLIQGAGDYLIGPVWDLTHLWANRDPHDYLDPTQWRATAIFGTTYATPQDSLYVWTDVGFSQVAGDVNGDGVVDGADRARIVAEIHARDGTEFDADGTVNGAVHIVSFGSNFSLYDINGDGVIDGNDLSSYPAPCSSDWNQDNNVNSTDFFQFLADFFNGHGDFNHDGHTDTLDFFNFLLAFFNGC